MKSIKKKLINTSLAFAMILGVAFSFTTQSAEANVLVIDDGGDKIPCWSSGSINPAFRYVECASCISKTGSPSGGKSTCTN